MLQCGIWDWCIVGFVQQVYWLVPSFASVICSSKYNLGTSHLQWIIGKLQIIVGSFDWWEFPSFFRCHWQSLAQPWQANCLSSGLCKETVEQSMASVHYLFMTASTHASSWSLIEWSRPLVHPGSRVHGSWRTDNRHHRLPPSSLEVRHAPCMRRISMKIWSLNTQRGDKLTPFFNHSWTTHF